MTFAGSTFAGFFCGGVLRKILKIIVIVAGTALGLFFLDIQYAANKGDLGAYTQINWDRISNDSASAFQHLYAILKSAYLCCIGRSSNDGLCSWNRDWTCEGVMNLLERSIINWCRLHPDAQYFLNCFAEAKTTQAMEGDSHSFGTTNGEERDMTSADSQGYAYILESPG